MNLAQISIIRETVQSASPDVIVNAAAYTKVDRAEKEPDLAMMVNGYAPGILAEEAKKTQALLIHFSTDFVFNGKKNGAYTEKDSPDPINVYGSTKLAGEQLIQKTGGLNIILRTSWVYGVRGNNFLTKLLKWTQKQDSLRIVQDQFGSPTWTRWLAQATAQVIRCYRYLGLEWMQNHKGLYHVASKGLVSRFEWGRNILDLFQLNETEIHPAVSSDFSCQAERPCNSALNSDKITEAFNIHIPNWREMLAAAISKDAQTRYWNLEENPITDQVYQKSRGVKSIPHISEKMNLEMAKAMISSTG